MDVTEPIYNKADILEFYQKNVDSKIKKVGADQLNNINPPLLVQLNNLLKWKEIEKFNTEKVEVEANKKHKSYNPSIR